MATEAKAERPFNVGGPVSSVLEADVRSWVRRSGIAVWLDPGGHYTAFVDRLVELRREGQLSYEVRAFRGSHLALMLELEGVATGTEKTSLLLHMPGFTEETVTATPMLELYEAGARYRKSLDTLVTDAAAGRVRPDRIAAFKEQPEMTLERADAWLGALLEGEGGGFAAQLRAMTPAAVLDDLLAGGFVASCVAEPGDANMLWERFTAWLGLPDAWRHTTLPDVRARAEDVAFAAASWALAVEYAHDLARAPVSSHLEPAKSLPRGVVDACRGLATHLRLRHEGFYQRTADETEALLADEVESARAEDLGKIDTFRFEEDKVLKAALAALLDARYDAAAEWAALRVGAESTLRSFWLRDATRQNAWQLVRGAAQLGQAIARAGERIRTKASADGLDGAVAAYVDRGAEVDQAHRHLEQRRVALLYPQLPEFESLRASLDALRLAWRTWADAWAREFNAMCVAHGFLPEASLQQRTLFDEVVRPLTQDAGGETTAYFVVDALRFEMAEELCRQLAVSPSTNVQLRPRLAELPTVTEVGMNVLAPAQKAGRLLVAMSNDGASVLGFQAGEFRVSDPETRKRAMHDRIGGGTCPWLTLEDVVSRDAVSLKRAVTRARLVVVHSQEIDSAGESGAGLSVFDHVMQKLRAAWSLLREAGVRRFVFTSDHGFLLLGDGAVLTQSHGRRIDPKRRHVFSSLAADHVGEVRVALSDLGYDGTSGYVMFPETTAVFDTGRRSMSFVHGGNSLQERVIPVLTVTHRASPGGAGVQYDVRAEARDGVGGMHCIDVTVELRDQHTLEFGAQREVELALRVKDVDGANVELCQARGKARIARGAVVATVGESFEVFFRLSGPVDARALVELYHPSAVVDVVPCVPEARFVVTAVGTPSTPPPPSSPARGAKSNQASWLDDFVDPGVRQVFEHLAAHGAVTESEALGMLGSARALRSFSLKFEAFAERAPFGVRIDVVAGIKRYVREGRG